MLLHWVEDAAPMNSDPQLGAAFILGAVRNNCNSWILMAAVMWLKRSNARFPTGSAHQVSYAFTFRLQRWCSSPIIVIDIYVHGLKNIFQLNCYQSLIKVSYQRLPQPRNLLEKPATSTTISEREKVPRIRKMTLAFAWSTATKCLRWLANERS